MHSLIAALSCALLSLAACDSRDDAEVTNSKGLQTFVANHRVGSAADQWVEIKNMSGEWERVGLIFGYVDDYDECTKAIGGLKKVNYAREYRCVPANEPAAQ